MVCDGERMDLPLYVKELTGDGVGNVPVHRYDGDGWYLYIPVSAWERAATSFPDDQWQLVSAYGTGSALVVGRFTTPVSILHDDARKQGFAPIDGTKQVWQYSNGNIRYYYHEAADGCWRVTVDWDNSRITAFPDTATEPDVLCLMAESFTVDDSFQGSAEPSQPPEDVSLLPGTGEPLSAEELTWFNDWFEPIVQDKQGNDIGVNPRCCFVISFYDDVTELNFEEFMRFSPKTAAGPARRNLRPCGRWRVGPSTGWNHWRKCWFPSINIRSGWWT